MTSKRMIYKFLQYLWRVVIGAPPRQPELHYFKCMENVEVAIDWGKRQLTFKGEKIVRATDDQSVWIRHTIRQNRESGKIQKV